MDVMEAVSMMLVMPIFFGTMAWGFKTLLDYLRQRRTATMLFERQNKVVDQFGTAPEALHYLESESCDGVSHGIRAVLRSPDGP